MYGLIPINYASASASGGANDWRRWNGSSSIPFSSLGASYYANNNSIATIIIDAERWLLISGSTSPTVRVGKFVDDLPVYGTPVTLDATINGATWFKGLFVLNDKIYINYSWYNGTQNVTYAKICNIDVDGNITFGTRSAQIGVSAPAGSAIPTTLALSAEGHPVHGFYASDTREYSLVTTTINVDDTITVNTIKNLGINGDSGSLSCQNPVVIFLTLENKIYAIQIIETVIDSILTSTDIYDLGDIDNSSNSITSVGLNQSIILYQRLSGVDSLVASRIATYDENSNTFSLGDEITFPEAIYAIELIKIGNRLKQVMAVFAVKTPDSIYANALASCLTPSGSVIDDSDPYPINANYFDSADLFVSPYQNQSAVLNRNIIIAPFVTYDDTNYGATILIRANTISPPLQIFNLEAKNATTTPQASLGNVVATIGSHLLAIISPINYESILLPGIKLLVSGSTFTVVEAAFAGAETLVTVVETTPSYTFVPCSLLGVTSLSDNDVTYAPVGGAQIPSLGEINGKPTIISYSTNSDAYLESNEFEFPMTLDATLFLVCKTIGTSDVLCSFKSANLTPLADVSSETVLIYPPNTSVGNYDLTSELSLISVVRQNSNTRVYINGILNDTLTENYAALAIGNPVQGRIGNNFAGTNYFRGYLSAISLWYGALSDSARQAQEAYYFAEYDIAPPEFGFALLSGDAFDLLSGTTFDLLGS